MGNNQNDRNTGTNQESGQKGQQQADTAKKEFAANEPREERDMTTEGGKNSGDRREEGTKEAGKTGGNSNR